MNELLQLKGPFTQKSRTGTLGAPQLKKGCILTADKLKFLYSNLLEARTFWSSQRLFDGALVSVFYNKLAAKSNRVTALLSGGGKTASDFIVGARFSDDAEEKHIITHFVSLQIIEEAIRIVRETIDVFSNEFGESVSDIVFNDKTTINGIKFNKYGIPKTTFQKVIVDASYVEKIDVLNNAYSLSNESIVTVYDTRRDIRELLVDLGIYVSPSRIVDNTTILLEKSQTNLLKERAPFLIAMATENISKLMPVDFKQKALQKEMGIPNPTNQPTIGVIDTLFDEKVYFKSWVESTRILDKEIPTSGDDYRHGTAVTSIIVDGPTLNPNLDDGCGRFRVRHFGVCTHDGFSSFSIIKAIKEVVMSNTDIRVWNLSLGSNEAVNKNFISVEGAALDQIQFDFDVVFVISATNKKVSEPLRKIGSPADSINSLVVASVDSDKKPAPYSREGIVLSFFTKPDIGYYGGANGNSISVCEPLGLASVSGSSFAAPWVARKLSYLIDVLGFSREVAKALIIDSAFNWDNAPSTTIPYIGYGVIPIHISEIITSPDDEIKFVVSGVSEKYDTYNYRFPVPMNNNKYPYIAKATLCYFPKCSRNQGVDYTNTELDLYFGRINGKKILSINNNNQSLDDETHFTNEKTARKGFRKWDNVKHIQDQIKEGMTEKKSYDTKLWGMSIKTKERQKARDGEGIHFGVVVTLKEIRGVNRIDDFIQLCSFNGWLVNKVNVENRIDVFQRANEDIKF